MSDKTKAIMTEEDWQNLRLQLRTLVDVYCELNNDVVKIKDLLKKIVKHLCKKEKACSSKIKISPKKTSKKSATARKK